MLPGIDTGGGGFQGSSSAQAKSAAELGGSRVFNFGSESGASSYVKYGILAASVLLAIYLMRR